MVKRLFYRKALRRERYADGETLRRYDICRPRRSERRNAKEKRPDRKVFYLLLVPFVCEKMLTAVAAYDIIVLLI